MLSNTNAVKQEDHVFSRRLFYLTAYSLTGAALMGSSIGLVVYQSQQIFFLNNLSSSLNHEGQYIIVTPAIDIAPTTKGEGESKEMRITVETFQRFASFLFSIWLPLSIWLVSLLATSLFARLRTVVPRSITPRAAILTSQAIFALFWIISGGLQEIEEKVSLIARSGASNESSNSKQQVEVAQFTLPPQTLQLMLVPLCVVWLVAVVLLGVATGLLTTSSSALEKQLQRGQQRLVTRVDESDDNNGMNVNKEWRSKDTQSKSVHLIMDEKSSRESNTKDYTVTGQYTTPQRIALGTLVLVLFSSQLRFFQWIISTGTLSSMETSHAANGCLSPVPTCLTMFGLISGITMITIGLRVIPANVDAEIDPEIDRV
ncbi:hypothetical protein BGX21_000591 [Mortierella sp. AD011]|nr:hypothetical protein BGX20_010718 [Mortierella sp. AD010]KAF9401797.1 hypothetical protein BGX21_000591 [Mortierella sp. AD011]